MSIISYLQDHPDWVENAYLTLAGFGLVTLAVLVTPKAMERIEYERNVLKRQTAFDELVRNMEPRKIKQGDLCEHYALEVINGNPGLRQAFDNPMSLAMRMNEHSVANGYASCNNLVPGREFLR